MHAYHNKQSVWWITSFIDTCIYVTNYACTGTYSAKDVNLRTLIVQQYYSKWLVQYR